jgi:predicted PurR-regulated permease PerM
MAEPNEQGWFSPRQRAVVAAGVTVFCATLVLAFATAIAWGTCSLLSAVSVVLTPLLVAVILTLLFKPYYNWLYAHLWRKHCLALPVFFISILLPLGAVLFFFGKLFVNNIIALIESLPALIARINTVLTTSNPAISAFIAKYNLADKIPLLQDPQKEVAEMVNQISLLAIGGKAFSLGVGAVKFVLSFIGWLVVPVYLIYFLMASPPDGRMVETYLPFLKPATRHDVGYLVDEFLGIVISYFRGQAIVAFIQGVLFGLGFWAVGLPYGMVIGLTLGLFNMVPYLGNIIGLGVTLPMAMWGDGGSLARLISVLAVFCVVQVVDGYFITPRIQGKRTGLSDVSIIFSLLFWGVVFQGFLGVLLAVPLSAFVVVFWRLLKKKYFKELI